MISVQLTLNCKFSLFALCSLPPRFLASFHAVSLSYAYLWRFSCSAWKRGKPLFSGFKMAHSGSYSVSHSAHFSALVSCYTPIFCITRKDPKFRRFFRFFRKSKRAVLSHFVTLSHVKSVTFCDMEQGRKRATECHYFPENLIFPDSAKIPFPYHQLPHTMDFSRVGGNLSISKHSISKFFSLSSVFRTIARTNRSIRKIQDIDLIFFFTLHIVLSNQKPATANHRNRSF